MSVSRDGEPKRSLSWAALFYLDFIHRLLSILFLLVSPMSLGWFMAWQKMSFSFNKEDGRAFRAAKEEREILFSFLSYLGGAFLALDWSTTMFARVIFLVCLLGRVGFHIFPKQDYKQFLPY